MVLAEMTAARRFGPAQTDITRGWPERLNRLSRWLDGSFIASVSLGETADRCVFADQGSKHSIVAEDEEEHRMAAITVASTDHEQVIDLTEKVAAQVASLDNGVCHLFTKHTTCALTILTDEEGIAEDLLSRYTSRQTAFEPDHELDN